MNFSEILLFVERNSIPLWKMEIVNCGETHPSQESFFFLFNCIIFFDNEFWSVQKIQLRCCHSLLCGFKTDKLSQNGIFCGRNFACDSNYIIEYEKYETFNCFYLCANVVCEWIRCVCGNVLRRKSNLYKMINVCECVV